jgi:hypothetical protein
MGLEPRKLQLWFDPGREEKSASGRRVPQDLIPEPAYFSCRIYVLPVIDDESARFRQPLMHLGKEVRGYTRSRCPGTTQLFQDRVRSLSKAFMARTNCFDQIADMQSPIAVIAIELVPIAGKVDFTFPLVEERGLTVAGIGGYDRCAAV